MPGVMSRVPLLKVISGLGKPVLRHRMITEVPLSRQRGLEGSWRPVTPTGTAEERTLQLTQDHKLCPPRASVPGVVTTTMATGTVPAALVTAAV